MLTLNQNSESLQSPPLTSANDDYYKYTFEDIAHHWKGQPVVARKTYERVGLSQLVICPEYKNAMVDYGELPCVMRGSRHCMMYKYYRKSDIYHEMKYRYIRMFKLTIITREDAIKVNNAVRDKCARNGMHSRTVDSLMPTDTELSIYIKGREYEMWNMSDERRDMINFIYKTAKKIKLPS